MFSTIEIISEEDYLQREFSSKEQKERVAKWRKAQTGNVDPSFIQRYDRNGNKIKVSTEGDIINNQRKILKKNKNIDPLELKERQSRTITFEGQDGPVKSTYKNRKGIEEVLKRDKARGYKDAEIELNQVYKKKAQDLRNKKMLKKAGKGALIVGGTAAAGYGAKKLYDKMKKKDNK